MNADTRDLAMTVGLVASFALLVTMHVVTVFGLARRRHFAAALGGFFVPPIAPYCAFTQGMKVRAALWVASAALYVVVRMVNR